MTTTFEKGDRVRTPMPVNAPNAAKSQRYTTQTGRVSAVRGGLVEVTMDKSEMRVTFTVESMQEANK